MARSPSKAAPNYLMTGFQSDEGFSFDIEAFDRGIRSQGVNMVHHRAIICPLGITDKNDTLRHAHPPHPGCSNGVLYKPIGIVRGLFVDNSANEKDNDIGTTDGSTARCTFPRHYDEVLCPGDNAKPRQIYVGTGDRFYLDERESNILWLTRELVEHSISGKDRLRFPAVEVENLIDNRLVEYRCGEHFDINENGELVWRQGMDPGMDADTPDAHGRVFTVWYLYRPYWYVDRIVHQGRPSQVQEGDTMERSVQNLPMEVSLTREVQFQNERAGGDNKNLRENRAPADGSFAG